MKGIERKGETLACIGIDARKSTQRFTMLEHFGRSRKLDKQIAPTYNDRKRVFSRLWAAQLLSVRLFFFLER